MSWRLTRELEATCVFDNLTAYCELLNGFTTRIPDLTNREGEQVLCPEPRIAYTIGHTLAQDVLSSGGNGLIYPSARRDGGCCLVAFRPHLVQKVRQGDKWTFAWRRQAAPEITRT